MALDVLLLSAAAGACMLSCSSYVYDLTNTSRCLSVLVTKGIRTMCAEQSYACGSLDIGPSQPRNNDCEHVLVPMLDVVNLSNSSTYNSTPSLRATPYLGPSHCKNADGARRFLQLYTQSAFTVTSLYLAQANLHR